VFRAGAARRGCRNAAEPTTQTRIAASLEKAWQAAGERQAVAHAERHGNYLEFAGSQGFDLALDSLEARRSGIRLLNVRVEGEGAEARTFATVYIPSNRNAYFLKKVRAYAEENTPKENRRMRHRCKASTMCGMPCWKLSGRIS